MILEWSWYHLSHQDWVPFALWLHSAVCGCLASYRRGNTTQRPGVQEHGICQCMDLLMIIVSNYFLNYLYLIYITLYLSLASGGYRWSNIRTTQGWCSLDLCPEWAVVIMAWVPCVLRPLPVARVGPLTDQVGRREMWLDCTEMVFSETERAILQFGKYAAVCWKTKTSWIQNKKINGKWYVSCIYNIYIYIYIVYIYIDNPCILVFWHTELQLERLAIAVAAPLPAVAAVEPCAVPSACSGNASSYTCIYIYISVYLWYLWYFWYLWDLNRWWNSETLPTFLIFLMFFHSFLHFFATSRLGRTTAIPQPRPWSHGSGQLAPAAGSQGKIARPVALSRSLFSMYIYISIYR